MPGHRGRARAGRDGRQGGGSARLTTSAEMCWAGPSCSSRSRLRRRRRRRHWVISSRRVSGQEARTWAGGAAAVSAPTLACSIDMRGIVMPPANRGTGGSPRPGQGVDPRGRFGAWRGRIRPALPACADHDCRGWSDTASKTAAAGAGPAGPGLRSAPGETPERGRLPTPSIIPPGHRRLGPHHQRARLCRRLPVLR
jgi:hypothetical protein